MDSDSNESFDYVGYEKHLAKIRDLIEQSKAAIARGDEAEASQLHVKIGEAIEEGDWTQKLLDYRKRLRAEQERAE